MHVLLPATGWLPLNITWVSETAVLFAVFLLVRVSCCPSASVLSQPTGKVPVPSQVRAVSIPKSCPKAVHVECICLCLGGVHILVCL